MKTKKDSNSKLSNFEIQIPFSGSVLRVERKLTMTKLIRVLLGLVVALTFLGNIMFILETRKMNSEGKNTAGDLGSNRESPPRRQDIKSKVGKKTSTTTTGTTCSRAISHCIAEDICFFFTVYSFSN